MPCQDLIDPLQLEVSPFEVCGFFDAPRLQSEKVDREKTQPTCNPVVRLVCAPMRIARQLICLEGSPEGGPADSVSSAFLLLGRESIPTITSRLTLPFQGQRT